MTGKTTGKKRMTIRLTEQNIERIEWMELAFGASENAVVNAAIRVLAAHAGVPEPEGDAGVVI